MVCAGTRKDPPPPDQLVGGHAYTVLGVMDGVSGIPKLIKLRNPWGKQQYNGPWSYSWLETRGMTQEAKLLYNHSRDEFWMPFTRFTKGFSTLFICHDLGPEFSEKNTTSVLTKRSKKIRFKLCLKTSCDTETFIAVSQMGRRRLRDELHSETNAKLPIKLQICHSGTLLFNQNFQKKRNRTHRMILSPGEYELLVAAEYVDEETPIFLRVAANCILERIELISITK